MARTLKCRHCGEYADSENGVRVPLGFFCSMSHVAAHGLDKSKAATARRLAKSNKVIVDEEKAIRRKLKQDKEALRPRSWYIKELQKHFNKFIRLRDYELPCISCGRHHQGQYHAGHYRTVGSSPELRFDELNCHKQCAPCNNHMSGNIVNYRPNLITKIGQQKVDWIEGPHEAAKQSIDELKALISHYKEKIKERAI